MVKWFKTYRSESPNSNHNLNNFIIDLRTDEELGGTAMNNAILAVKKITEEYPPPYTLFASGGIDSQAMIIAWENAKVDFKVVHYDYGSNTDDTESIVKFCNKKNINLEIKFFDAKKFIMSHDLKIMASRYNCVSPQILTYIELVKQHDETCIMSGNFISYGKCGIDWTIYGLERFSKIEKQNFIPFFFLSSPRLAYSFVNLEEKIKNNIFSQYGSCDSYLLKTILFKLNGFFVSEQDKKYTGFEKIKDSFDGVVIDIKTIAKWRDMPSRRPFDILYRYSLFDEIGGRYGDNTTVLINKNIAFKK